MKIIDLTHIFTDKMPVFEGNPPARLTQVTTIKKSGYNDHSLTTYMHVGTHMDAPLHMITNGKKMDEISPENFFGQGVLIDARGKNIINSDVLKNTIFPKGAIVLIYTGFANKYRNSSYFNNQPTISDDFAQEMVELKVKIVGMDILGPDQPPFPVHKRLLGNEILIIENLTNLECLLDTKKFEVVALPMKLNADAAPVRVIAKILEQ